MSSVLYVITPFKGLAQQLEVTCCSLAGSGLHRSLNLIVVSDPSSYVAADSVLSSYIHILSVRHVKSIASGIYPAINQGLSCIPLQSWYVVIGAGDLLCVEDLSFLSEARHIFRIPYRLASNPSIVYNQFRPILSGMPYCHNALFFRHTGIKYNESLRISSDYDYWLSCIQAFQSMDQVSLAPLRDGAFVLFDDVSGISSNRKLALHRENIAVLVCHFGIASIFSYLGFYAKKFVLRAGK